MLNVEDPSNVWREIQACLKLAKKHLDLEDELERSYLGSHYRQDIKPTVESHENHGNNLMVNVLPHLCYFDGRVTAESSRPWVHRDVVPALKHGINHWLKVVKHSEKLEPVCVDFLSGHGVTLTTLDAVPGYEDVACPPLMPHFHHVSRKRFFVDPQAISRQGIRIVGHALFEDKDDLLHQLDEDGETLVYYPEVIKRLTPDAGREQFEKQMGDVERVPRNQVVLYEVYLPEYREIRTYAFDSGSHSIGPVAYMVRDPRPYKGPPWGPYTLYGCYVAPGQVYPLSPLAVTQGLANELNAHLSQMKRDADESKTQTIINSTNEVLQKALTTGKNGRILAIPGFSKDQVHDLVSAGPSPEQMDYVDRLRSRLDRESGLIDTIRGNVTGATKGEVEIGQANANVRIAYMKRVWQRCVTYGIESAAWLMTNNNFVAFYMPDPSTEAHDATLGGRGQPQEDKDEVIFLGGTQPGQEPLNFDDLQITLCPNSMAYRDPDLERQSMEAVLNAAVSVGPVMPTLPWFRWGEIWDDYCAAHQVPDSRKYMNVQILEAVCKTAMLAPAGQSGDAKGDPKTSAVGQAAGPSQAGAQGGRRLTGPPGQKMGAAGPSGGGGGPLAPRPGATATKGPAPARTKPASMRPSTGGKKQPAGAGA